MKLTDLGERRLIREVISPLLASQQPNYFGNDCAVVPINERQSFLITTDAGPRRSFMTTLGVGNFVDLGYFFATMSLSDIAAMAGRPIALTAACMFQPDFKVEDFEQILNGIALACKEASTSYVGGDTKEGTELRVVTTAAGLVDNDKMLTRRGAHVGDLVCTSGGVGRTLGSYLLAKHHENQGGVLRSRARIEFSQILAREGLATSCMDMSDGPISTAETLAELNSVMIHLNVEALQLARPPTDKISGALWKTLVLSVGGDFELMFTADPSKRSRLAELGALICGRVESANHAGGVRIRSDVEEVLNVEPWEHFRTTEAVMRMIKELQ